MKINGLKVDTRQIAAGLYDIICEHGESHIVAFGMIPKWIMDLLAVQLRNKINSIVEAQQQVTIEEISRYFNVKPEIEKIVQAIVRQVCTDIYGVAKKCGGMVV